MRRMTGQLAIPRIGSEERASASGRDMDATKRCLRKNKPAVHNTRRWDNTNDDLLMTTMVEEMWNALGV